MVEKVTHRAAEQRAWRLHGPVRLAPGDELFVHRLRPARSLLEPVLAIGSAHVGLDVVQGLEGLDGDGCARVVGLERFYEVATRVHVAPYLHEVRTPERLVEDA